MLSLREELFQIEFGQYQHFRNLTLFPLLRSAAALPARDYLLLDDGIAQNLVHVTELHAAGSVPELFVTNDAALPVLLVDGEELLGAKQNRVLNLSILIPAHFKCSIPVSCVEAGRWRMASAEFKTADHFYYGSARAQRLSQVTDSMRATGSRLSVQEAVWDEVASKLSRLDTQSPTRAVAEIYARHSASLDEFARVFHWQERQCGVAFAISGSISGIDVFDHPEVMRHFFPKLLRSFVLDALDSPAGESSAPSEASLSAFLSAVAGSAAFADNAIGLGKDVRFTAPSLSGAALWAQDRYLHVCAFPSASTPTPHASFHTRMSRPKQRRGF